jgi:hypothetical protein
MALSPELLNRIAQWREKSRNGTITKEELQEAILVMREDRLQKASSAPASKSSKKSRSSVDTDALFSELEGL